MDNPVIHNIYRKNSRQRDAAVLRRYKYTCGEKELQEVGHRTALRLLMQYFVLPIVCGRTAEKLFK